MTEEYRRRAEKAAELKASGLTYDEISAAMGVSKQSVGLYLRTSGDAPPRKDRRFTVEDLEAAVAAGAATPQDAAARIGCSMGTMRNLVRESGIDFGHASRVNREMREREALRLFRDGVDRQMIAKALGVTLRTVARYIGGGWGREGRVRVARSLLAGGRTRAEVARVMGVHPSTVTRWLK